MGYGRVAAELSITGSVSRHNSQKDLDDDMAWNNFIAAVSVHVDAIRKLADQCEIINDIDFWSTNG